YPPVLLDVVNFSNNHLPPSLNQPNIQQKIPSLISYPHPNKTHLYFLYYLILIPSHLLLFHPQPNHQFPQLHPQQNLTFIHHYPATSNLQPFPTQKPERKSTLAYRSTSELQE
ncbi:YceG family protein, partial [Bacillus altitudinis]|uniref:YceG family protein n=1 Tax=Bacillus altitudinis TaxID=293387 RepID=UPI001C92D185